VSRVIFHYRETVVPHVSPPCFLSPSFTGSRLAPSCSPSPGGGFVRAPTGTASQVPPPQPSGRSSSKENKVLSLEPPEPFGSTVFISEKGALVNSIVILAFCPVPNKTRGKRQQITSARVAFTLREVSLLVDLQLSVGCTGHLLTNRAKPVHSSLRAPMHNMSCAKAEGCPIKYVGVLPQKTVRAHPRSPFRKHRSSP